jgi:hypothetical protein
MHHLSPAREFEYQAVKPVTVVLVETVWPRCKGIASNLQL